MRCTKDVLSAGPRVHPTAIKQKWQFESQDQGWNQIWDLEAAQCSSLHSTPSSFPHPSPALTQSSNRPCYGWPQSFRLRCQKPPERDNKVLPGGLSQNHNGSLCINLHFFLGKGMEKFNQYVLPYHMEFWNPGVKTSNVEWPLILKKLEILSLTVEN